MLKDTNLLVWLPWTSRKQSTIFINSSSNLVLSTCSILSAKIDLLVCVDLVLWMELNKFFLCVFLKSSFLNAGHSVHSSVLVKMNCPLHIIKELSTLDINFTPEWVLNKCIQTVHVLVVATEYIRFLLQLFFVAHSYIVSSAILGSTFVIVASNTKFFAHSVVFICVYWKKILLHFEKFVWKPGITCSTAAAIWILSRFPNKWIWKTRYYYTWYKPTKKAKGFLCGLVTRQWRKRERICLYGNVTWLWPKQVLIPGTNCSSKVILYLSFTQMNHFF